MCQCSNCLRACKLFRVPIIIFALGLLIVTTIVPSIVVTYLQQNADKVKLVTKATNYPTSNKPFNGIVVMGNVTGIDVNNCLLKMTWKVEPSDDLVDDNTFMLNAPLTVDFDGAQVVTFPAKQRITNQDITFPLSDCDLNAYPFDSYALIESYFDAKSDDDYYNVTGSISGGILGFEVFKDAQMDEFGYFTFNIRIYRSWTTKFFSGFIFILLWLISLGSMLFTLLFFFFDAVELPIVAITTALLFAMPNVRNTQPGIPGIGCTSDIAGFFWNMMIVALCCTLYLCSGIHHAQVFHGQV